MSSERAEGACALAETTCSTARSCDTSGSNPVPRSISINMTSCSRQKIKTFIFRNNVQVKFFYIIHLVLDLGHSVIRREMSGQLRMSRHATSMWGT